MPALRDDSALILTLTGSVAGLFGLFFSSILLASAWVDTTGDRAHPEAQHTYRLYADVNPEIRAFATRSSFEVRLFRVDALHFVQAGHPGLTAVTSVSDAGPIRLGRAPHRQLELNVVQVDENFTRFFQVRRLNGAPPDLSERGPGIWLTRSAAETVSAAAGGHTADLEISGRLFPVHGVIEDPPAGSHLVYDGVVTGVPATLRRNLAIYLRTQDPDLAARALSRGLSEAMTGEPIFFVAGLHPVINFRLRRDTAIGEADFIVTDQGLEAAAALAAGLAALAGSAVAASLLTSAYLNRRRLRHAVRIVLGASPRQVSLALLAGFCIGLAAVSLLAGGLVFTLGEGVLRALNKPPPSALLGPVSASFLLTMLALLGTVAATLAPLSAKVPSRLMSASRRAHSGADAALVLGVSVLAAAGAVLALAAAQFATEVHTGARLDVTDTRTWRAQPENRESLARLESVLSRSPLVEDWTVQHWSPYDEILMNRAVQLDGGRLEQVSLLTGDTSWSRFRGASVLYGQLPMGPAPPDACYAILEHAAAQLLSPDGDLDLTGRRLSEAESDRSCVIAAVVTPIRRGKLASFGDPVVYLHNADRATQTLPQGEQPAHSVFVRARAGVGEETMRALLNDAAALRSAPRNVEELGAAAYARERRMARVLAGASGAMVSVFLSVSLALALMYVSSRRYNLAIRLALGHHPLSLAFDIIGGVAAAACLGGVAAFLIGGAGEDAWRRLGGLSMTGDLSSYFWSYGPAAVICIAPVVFVLGVSFFAIRRISPASLLQG